MEDDTHLHTYIHTYIHYIQEQGNCVVISFLKRRVVIDSHLNKEKKKKIANIKREKNVHNRWEKNIEDIHME